MGGTLLYLALVLGGAALGVAVAVVVAGGSEGSIFVGFIVPPLAFGAAMLAWRAVLGAWLASHVVRSAFRSRGDDARFRADAAGRLERIRAAGPAGLPGAWVFVPISAAVGLAGGLAMVVAASENGLAAGFLLAMATIGQGLLLRRLARAGRLPLPDE
jgi:hypothetical protein